MSANIKDKTVIALGFFDGVHKGHAELIKLAKKRAQEIGASPAVLSFDASPESVITGLQVSLISSMEIRKHLVCELFGVENVIFYHFDKNVMAMKWTDFIDSLVSEFSACHFVIGHDFSCGYKGEGKPELIRAFCAEKKIGCDIVPKFQLDGITVSSTYIRGLIAGGNIERAAYFLGHPYIFAGTVSGGRRVGRNLGTPTINLKCPPELILPANGVYATRVLVDEKTYNAVTNVGVRPTFDDGDTQSVESYIFDFSGNLYNKSVMVEFIRFIRFERRFENVEKLREQIENDCAAARKLLSEIDN